MFLAVALLMFPQVVETIYSPALPSIAKAYGVSTSTATLTLSLYFLGFASGVVFWGRMCDLAGRRPSMLLGLAVYGLGTLVALLSSSFTALLTARIVSAFGAAVGSIGTQTILRDRFEGAELTRVFSLAGIAIAISPALGMAAGAVMTGLASHKGVFIGLAALALCLFIWTAVNLPETRRREHVPASLRATIADMIRDGHIWRSASLIALLNLCLFSYYQLAPFHFEELRHATITIGYSGVVLTAGTLAGAMSNRALLQYGWRPERLVLASCLLIVIGGLLVTGLKDSILFVAPVAIVSFAFAVAVPNVLAPALQAYSTCLGTAGAVFGLIYYLLIGGGLLVSGAVQDLGAVFTVSGICAFALAAGDWQKAAVRTVT
ncbi:MFS transporter [Stappia taiwanensis]|nr:MFS transporter [Stappia taiwanensis]